MTTRYEGAGAKDTTLTVLTAGEEIGVDVVPEGQIALCFNYDEVFYIQGEAWDVIQLLQDGVNKAKHAAAKAMKLFDLESIQPSPDARAANESRVRGEQEPCAVCGKPVRDVEALQIHLSERGNVYPASINVDMAHQMPEGTMYFFPVGPDCAKKIPAGYLHIKPKEKQ